MPSVSNFTKSKATRDLQQRQTRCLHYGRHDIYAFFSVCGSTAILLPYFNSKPTTICFVSTNADIGNLAPKHGIFSNIRRFSLFAKKQATNQQLLTKKSAGTTAGTHIIAKDRKNIRSLKGKLWNQNISILFTTLKSAQTSFLWIGNEG